MTPERPDLERPRLLMVVPLPPPMAGVEQMSEFLINSSLARDFDLRVLKSNIRESNSAKGAWDFAGISRVLMVGLRLIWALITFRPRLVYLCVSQNGAGLVRDCFYIGLCRLACRPVVGHLHGSALHQFLASRPPWYRAALLFFLRHLEKIITLAESIRRDLVPYLASSRLVVVYNAIPASSGMNERKPDGQRLVVSFMGHLSRAKGFFDLLAAARPLLERHGELVFQFAGERLDNERNVPTALVSSASSSAWSEVERLQKDFPSRVLLKGVVSGELKKEFFRESDLFVFPSLSEAFPLVILEAMAAGLPLITTRVGALPEILADSENCIFVERGSVAQLTEAISLLTRDNRLRAHMSAANLALSRRFDIEVAAEGLRHVFVDALQQVRLGRRSKSGKALLKGRNGGD